MKKATRALVLSALLVAAACGDDGDDTDDTAGSPSDGTEAESTDGAGGGAEDTTAGSAAEGAGDTGDGCESTVPGTQVNFGVWAPTHQIDPILTSGGLVGGHEIAAVYDVLFRYDFETEEFVPHLAESMTPNDDYTVWTLTLREGIEYSDGTPLTAELVSENIDRFFGDRPTNTSAGFMAPIVDKQVVDDVTLEITLDSPWVEFPFVFSDEPGMIVNTNAIGDDPEAFANQPPDEAGLGPYVVERNAPNEELVLKAREDYWGGPVCIETLRFTFVPGAQASYDAFQNGDLDVAFLREPEVIAAARENGEESFWVQQDSGAALLINHADGRPGSDPRIREAIWLALDEQVIADRVYQGNLTAGKSYLQEGSRFYSDDIEAVPVDTERASQLVEEAKAEGFDGELDVLCTTSPPSPDTALTAEGLLEAVGFDVTTETLGQGEQIGQVIQGDFDTACWGFNGGPETGLMTTVRSFRSDSEVNRMGYQSDEMDAALDELLAADTPEAQQAAMAQVNNIYVGDFVTASFGAIDEGIVWQPEVQGIVSTTSTIQLFHDAYLDGAG